LVVLDMYQAAGAIWRQEIITKPSGRKTSHVGLACKERQKNILLVRIREKSEIVSVSCWYKSLCRICAVMPIDFSCVEVRHHRSSYITHYLNVTVASKNFLSSSSLMMRNHII
jgi:hypothetical protein